MISFIYFDCGGVVYKDFSDSNKWQEMQADMGINNSNREEYLKIWQSVADRLCIDYDVDDLIPILNDKLNLNTSADYSMVSDFIDRFEPNPSIWPIVEKINATHRLGLLTNQYPRLLDAAKKADILIPPAKWEVIVDSSIEKTKKPEEKIFLIAQEKANVPVDELLFIDNSLEHVEAAKQLGWHTFHYDSAAYTQSTKSLEIYLRSQRII